MIKLNKQWSIERHIHGGFHLIETKQGINKKTGEPTESKRSYYYPRLEFCAKKMVECGFDNEAQDLEVAVKMMGAYVLSINSRLDQLIETCNE